MTPDPNGVVGLQGVRDHVNTLRSAFPDLAFHVEDMIAESEPLPASVEEGGRAAVDTGAFHDARVILVPVEMPGIPAAPIPASAQRS